MASSSGSTTLPLLARLPDDGSLPHVSLASLPTPVERLEELGASLGLEHLYIKRDDLSGPLYGGNKVRKLEFLFGEAVAQGFEEVVTLGAIGSHHVLATSIYARHLGLKPCAHHFPQPLTAHVLDNLRALSTTQPELTLLGHPAALPFHQFKKHLMDWLAHRPSAYYIKGGGSSVTGTLGYVNAAFELAEQIEEGQMPMPDEIHVAAGTLGTMAGLIVGAKMANLSSKIIGVRVVDRIVTNSANVLAMANATSLRLQKLGLDAPLITPADFELRHDLFGEAYGEPTAAGAQAMELFSKHTWETGLKLDPTYTAKAFSSITRHAPDSAKNGSPVVLYWHTLNGIDLSERLAQADPWRDLPAAYHAFFQEDA